MTTPSEVITALEKALEAGTLHSAIMNIQVTEQVKSELEGPPKGFYLLGHRDARHAAAELASAQDVAIRTLLDAHASAVRANAELLDQMHHFANADQRLWDEGQRDAESFKSWVRSRAAHLLAKFNRPAALDDNPKGACHD